ncbi:hypothetical protein C5N14_16645 [Micromonospora sp. MW-13]|nr:hypothetical protein C5N14_16645 [Micromonospora sp. MW-13]
MPRSPGCLKRHIVRDVYTALVADFAALTT